MNFQQNLISSELKRAEEKKREEQLNSMKEQDQVFNMMKENERKLQLREENYKNVNIKILSLSF